MYECKRQDKEDKNEEGPNHIWQLYMQGKWRQRGNGVMPGMV